jgi:hypothetical protein
MGLLQVSLKNTPGGASPATEKLQPREKRITLVSSYLLKPQAVPGSQDGTGDALLLAIMVAFGVVATDLEASIWSAAKPVISIPRTRARTAIFMVGCPLVTMYLNLSLGSLDKPEYTDLIG